MRTNGRPLNQDSQGVQIPRVVCPECGGKLFASVHESDAETGLPTTCGIQIDCENENWNDDETWNHRWYQSDWLPIVEFVNQWAGAIE